MPKMSPEEALHCFTTRQYPADKKISLASDVPEYKSIALFEAILAAIDAGRFTEEGMHIEYEMTPSGKSLEPIMAMLQHPQCPKGLKLSTGQFTDGAYYYHKPNEHFLSSTISVPFYILLEAIQLGHFPDGLTLNLDSRLTVIHRLESIYKLAEVVGKYNNKKHFTIQSLHFEVNTHHKNYQCSISYHGMPSIIMPTLTNNVTEYPYEGLPGFLELLKNSLKNNYTFSISGFSIHEFSPSRTDSPIYKEITEQIARYAERNKKMAACFTALAAAYAAQDITKLTAQLTALDKIVLQDCKENERTADYKMPAWFQEDYVFYVGATLALSHQLKSALDLLCQRFTDPQYQLKANITLARALFTDECFAERFENVPLAERARYILFLLAEDIHNPEHELVIKNCLRNLKSERPLLQTLRAEAGQEALVTYADIRQILIDLRKTYSSPSVPTTEANTFIVAYLDSLIQHATYHPEVVDRALELREVQAALLTKYGSNNVTLLEVAILNRLPHVIPEEKALLSLQDEKAVLELKAFVSSLQLIQKSAIDIETALQPTIATVKTYIAQQYPETETTNTAPLSAGEQIYRFFAPLLPGPREYSPALLGALVNPVLAQPVVTSPATTASSSAAAAAASPDDRNSKPRPS